jgi:hypothetical protein
MHLAHNRSIVPGKDENGNKSSIYVFHYRSSGLLHPESKKDRHATVLSKNCIELTKDEIYINQDSPIKVQHPVSPLQAGGSILTALLDFGNGGRATKLSPVGRTSHGTSVLVF